MDATKGLGNDGLEPNKLTDPEPRYTLLEHIGSGVYSEVHTATDNQTGKKVAVKILRLNPETKMEIEEEYKILRDLSDHPNLPDFYGVYIKKSSSPTQQDQIWFVMQLCEGGSITDLVKGLIEQNRRISEFHIAYILRETVKALNHLHENHVLHRDVKGSNVLLTKEGEIKLVDFGISREVGSTLGKCHTSMGTPSYMAPEVVMSTTENKPYDNRADVWALGVTAIELGDGVSPYQDMHPTRALFQIVRNPPPTLYRPANWSQDFNDFIAECLTKNPEHRPFMNEVIEHPFLTQLPENDFHLSKELKSLLETIKAPKLENRKLEVKVKTGKLKKKEGESPEPMYLEDLAALESLSEDSVLHTLEHRFNKDQVYTFLGDVLVCLNPHKELDIYTPQHQSKYNLKSRSANEPHVYSVADAAYQDMQHHQADQHIILSGETMSGKTTQYRHILRQLLYLGQSSNKVGERVLRASEILEAFGNGATPSNGDSTRHILHSQVTFSSSGTASGAVFWLYQLEKSRVTQRNVQHANFHIFYYLYDSLVKAGTLELYKLDASKQYRYLRRDALPEGNAAGPREDIKGNPAKLDKIVENLTALGFEPEESSTIWRVLAAILILGEIEYVLDDDGHASIKDNQLVDNVADLLELDSKKLGWALINYCMLESDTVSRRKLSLPEANRARGALARNLYSRLVDWIVNSINQKLALTRVVFGDRFCVSILDYFGFECFPKNSLEQLLVNTFNEQIQFYYNQRVFVAEMMDQAAEEVEGCKLLFLDNKTTLDELMSKPEGVIFLLDEADKSRQDYEFVMEALKRKDTGGRVEAVDDHQFAVAHYTGKVSYDSTAMVQKNRDFVPPELTEAMRQSKNSAVKTMFCQRLSKTGNVTAKAAEPAQQQAKSKSKWGAALLSGDAARPHRKYNTLSRGEYSQTRGIRPLGSIYRATCVEIMRNLSEDSAHFVRCVRTSLGQGFQPSLVRQQIRALSLVDTANARKFGYPYRVVFSEFLKRYKFLAFEFDETVDETMDNCRLLLVRLKLEGYVMGKNKIFLKYFNEEYLSRLYETQVKKIVKVQSMLRAFLAKRNMNKQRASRANSEDVDTGTIPE